MAIGYANTYELNIGGGGSAPSTPLVAGANPASQYVASGTTSIVFAFPSATGGTGSLSYGAPSLTKPTGSTATVSGTAPGNITISNATNGESYLVRVYVTDSAGQQVLNDAIGAVDDAALVPMNPVVPPARQALANSATSATVTFTQTSPPAGVVYSIAVTNVTTGASITPSSGSGLGPYVFAVSAGNDYVAILTATALDGQVRAGTAQVAVANNAVLTPGTNPAAQYVASGTTSIVFAFPAASGGKPSLVYGSPTLTKPSGSSATVSGTAPGNVTINNAANGESYLVRVYVTDANGQEVLNDAIGAVEDVVDVLPQIVPPARQSLASTTTSASVTFTQPGAPVGMVYSAVISNVTTGATITPTSGSGLGAYVFAVSMDNDYIVTLTGTAPDGQIAKNVAQVAVAATPTLTMTAPTTIAVAAGTTSATINWTSATGGVAPYSYDPQVTYDSTDTYVAYISAITSSSVTYSGLVNGQLLTVAIDVQDSVGATTSVSVNILVAASPAGTMTPGAFPATQTLASTSTTTSIAFNSVGGVFTAPVTYVASVSSGVATVSNIGTSVSVSALSPDSSTLVRLRATDSSGTPQTADAFCLITVDPSLANPLTWQTIRQINFQGQGTIGPFVSGANTFPVIDEITGDSVSVTLTYSMGAGSFGTMTCGITAANGWRQRFASTSTGTFVRGPMVIPLPVTLGADDDVRITIVGRMYNVVSANSAYFQINKSGSGNESSSDTTGFRLLRSGVNTALYPSFAGAAGAILNQTSTPPVPTTWQDGTVTLTETLYFPRYTNRPRFSLSGTGSLISCDLGATGVSPSATASRPGYMGGVGAITLQHCSSNGAANGGGNQFSEIYSIRIQRRTLP